MCATGEGRIVRIVDDISVLIVDDHRLFAEALQARLLCEPDLRPVWVARTATEARTRIAARPHVAVLDVDLAGASGLDLIDFVLEACPETRVVMLSGVDSVDSVVTALRRGAQAWLPKTVDSGHLVRVIRGVTRGEAWLSPDLLGRVLPELLARTGTQPPEPLAVLTPREREVLQCMVDGISRAETAVRLHVSANTVRTHTQNVMAKLGAHSTLESVAVALRHGIRASGS
jgi:DNA-binding NarL/FixJ family response regulator